MRTLDHAGAVLWQVLSTSAGLVFVARFPWLLKMGQGIVRASWGNLEFRARSFALGLGWMSTVCWYAHSFIAQSSDFWPLVLNNSILILVSLCLVCCKPMVPNVPANANAGWLVARVVQRRHLDSKSQTSQPGGRDFVHLHLLGSKAARQVEL